jgi:Cu-Zn family superoxide dismutase
MHRVRLVLLMLGVLTLGIATVAFAGPDRDDDDRDGDRSEWRDRGDDDDDDDDGRGRSNRFATATLMNSAGARVGQVWFYERRRDRGVEVVARVRDLPAGFHGFHLHTTGVCTPPEFTSAGGHYNPTNAMHPNHAGDMSTLLVNGDGTGMVALETDRFSVSDLRAGDGSAVIVHSMPDNYANIPPRYTPQPPDQTTMTTGDAGSRLACGQVR